jgi:hypothetical protein
MFSGITPAKSSTKVEQQRSITRAEVMMCMMCEIIAELNSGWRS